MFDFTKEVALDEAPKKLYRKLQLALYSAAFLAAIFLSYLIIFPQKYFSFDFSTPNSEKNNIINPHILNSGEIKNGKIEKNENFIWNTDASGNYSTAAISLSLSAASQKPETFPVSIIKTYTAFMYPEGEAMGFRNGSLLQSAGNYYLISNGQARKFSTAQILSGLGYSPKAFQEISADELKYNSAGEEIRNTSAYPNATLFKINGGYYILENQMLKKFLSEKAFFTRYNAEQAIEKNPDFLNNYPLSPDFEGFADGTLLSNGDSVFIASGKKILPVDNAITFTSKGYLWEDIAAAGADEISSYEKTGLFNINQSHPDGTIFKTSDSEKYYMIINQKKHLLPSQNIFASWNKKRSPILISEKSLETKIVCRMENNLLNSRAYSCEAPLKNINDFLGSNYGFNLTPSDSVEIDSLSISLKKNINKDNLKEFIIKTLTSIKSSYVQTPAE